MKEIKGRPNWDQYYMGVAKAISARSTCMRRKYGAVIVDSSNAIVSTGYNGSPVGAVNCVDRGTCRREEMHIPKGERYELCEAVHAEQNAIINCTKLRMVGATIYIYGENADGTIASGKPCLLCARMIRNAGIKRIVSSHKDVEFEAVSWEELERSLKDPKPDLAKDNKMDIVAFSDQDGNIKRIECDPEHVTKVKTEHPLAININLLKAVKVECRFFSVRRHMGIVNFSILEAEKHAFIENLCTMYGRGKWYQSEYIIQFSDYSDWRDTTTLHVDFGTTCPNRESIDIDTAAHLIDEKYCTFAGKEKYRIENALQAINVDCRIVTEVNNPKHNYSKEIIFDVVAGQDEVLVDMIQKHFAPMDETRTKLTPIINVCRSDPERISPGTILADPVEKFEEIKKIFEDIQERVQADHEQEVINNRIISVEYSFHGIFGISSGHMFKAKMSDKPWIIETLNKTYGPFNGINYSIPFNDEKCMELRIEFKDESQKIAPFIKGQEELIKLIDKEYRAVIDSSAQYRAPIINFIHAYFSTESKVEGKVKTIDYLIKDDDRDKLISALSISFGDFADDKFQDHVNNGTLGLTFGDQISGTDIVGHEVLDLADKIKRWYRDSHSNNPDIVYAKQATSEETSFAAVTAEPSCQYLEGRYSLMHEHSRMDTGRFYNSVDKKQELLDALKVTYGEFESEYTIPFNDGKGYKLTIEFRPFDSTLRMNIITPEKLIERIDAGYVIVTSSSDKDGNLVSGTEYRAAPEVDASRDNVMRLVVGCYKVDEDGNACLEKGYNDMTFSEDIVSKESVIAEIEKLYGPVHTDVGGEYSSIEIDDDGDKYRIIMSFSKGTEGCLVRYLTIPSIIDMIDKVLDSRRNPDHSKPPYRIYNKPNAEMPTPEVVTNLPGEEDKVIKVVYMVWAGDRILNRGISYVWKSAEALEKRINEFRSKQHCGLGYPRLITHFGTDDNKSYTLADPDEAFKLITDCYKKAVAKYKKMLEGAYRALSDENAQDTKTKPVVGIDAMAVRIMTDITFNNNKRGCCTYIPTSQKAIFFRSMIDKFGALNCDGENAYSTKTNAAKISIRTYLVPAEEVTACGAGAAIDKVREVFHEGFQEFMRMPINHKAYELNPVTVSFYAINKDNTYEKAVNVSVAIGDFDNLIASINRIVEAYHYSPVFLAKNVNCPNIFPGSEKYTEGNKTYSYQRDGHFDIVVVTNKATIPTTLISLADAVTAIASIVVGC